jgi:hypothetical protein
MSFSFYIKAPFSPEYQNVMDGLDYWDIHCEEGNLEDSSWPEGTFHFYRDHVSARGVEITYQDNQFQVRILTLASPDDYELGFRFVESLAGILDQRVKPEDYEPIPVDQLRERYNADWIHQTNTYGAAVIREMLQGGEHELMTLYGSKRPFHLGLRTIQELEDGGPEEEFLDRLMESILRVQNVDGNEYFFATIMEAKRNLETEDSEEPQEGEAETDNKMTFAVFAPTVQYLMPDVQYIALVQGEDEAPMFIPYDKLPLLLPEDSWSFIDERQMLIDAVDEEDWPGFLHRARKFEVFPFEEK